MSICAFFGHRNAPMVGQIETNLKEAARELIDLGVDEFWLCEQGTFDCLARITMKELRKEFRWIYLCIVPAYNPSKAKSDWMEEQNYELIYPEIVAKSPPQVAILRRNEYIAQNADYIICYITHNSGGAYKAVEKARKYGKVIINIADKSLLK